MTSRLFTLKTDAGQLSAGNRGMAEMHYVQYAPSRDVTGANFSNGAQYIKWTTSGQKWWIPQRTYLRMRATLTDGTGNPLTGNDKVAPNMNLMSTLFQSLEFRIAGQTVCRMSDYVPQIDTLDKRMTKSKAWLDSVGASTCFMQPDVYERLAAVSEEGIESGKLFVYPNDLGIEGAVGVYGNILDWFLDYVTPNQIQITAANQLIFTPNGGRPIPDLSNYFAIGERIAINDGAEKIRRVTAFVTTNTTNDTLVVDGAALTAVAAANLLNQVRKRKISIDYTRSESRRIDGFEIIWQPALGIFKVPHAMPAGDYELVLNPQNANTYKQAAIEAILEDKQPGALATNYQFDVVDMYLYVAQVEGIRIDNMTYLLDLEEIGCQRRSVQAATGLQQEEFTVQPSTTALTLGFQDSRAGSSNTLYSQSKLKIAPNTGLEYDLKLIRMYLNYAGMNKPQPDADPSYKVGSAEDYMIQRYSDSIMYNGTYFSMGGAESERDWRIRGPYYHFAWPKDATDRSTRVFANYQFSQAVPNGTLLLFNHFLKYAQITVENGAVIRVVVKET